MLFSISSQNFLHVVIPNSVSEARVFFSARVGVRDLLFLFELYNICEIYIAKTVLTGTE